MSWFKGDDNFHDQMELAYISEAAVCLFWCAVSWCSSAGTDGFVPTGQLPRLKGGRDEVVEELCKSYGGSEPWFVPVEGGWQIRTFLKHNPSKSQVQENREKEARRKQAWRDKHRLSHGTGHGTPPMTGRVTDGETRRVTDGAPGPTPSNKRKDKPFSIAPSDVPLGQTPGQAEGHWDRFFAAYPKRAGSTNKAEGCKRFLALVRSGEDPERIIAGANRYAAYCRATGKIGTEFVQQVSTFLGASRGWEEDFELPDAAPAFPRSNGKPIGADAAIAAASAFDGGSP